MSISVQILFASHRFHGVIHKLEDVIGNPCRSKTRRNLCLRKCAVNVHIQLMAFINLPVG